MNRSGPWRAAAPQNPGLVDAKAKRCTKPQMEEARQLAAAEKAAKVQKTEAGFSRIAHHKDEMQVDEMNTETAHPQNLSEVNNTKEGMKKVGGPHQGNKKTQAQLSVITRPQPRPIQPGRKVASTHQESNNPAMSDEDVEIFENPVAAKLQQLHAKNAAPLLDEPTHRVITMPRRLERSYALSNIDSYYNNKAYSNNKTPTERDDDLEYVEEGGNKNTIEYVTDDDPTPKKKRKSNARTRTDLKTKEKKKTAREQVDAQREKPGYGKNMVYHDENDEHEVQVEVERPKSLATFTKSMSGPLPLEDWVSQIEVPTSRKPSTIRTATSATARSHSTKRTTNTSTTVISTAKGDTLKPQDERSRQSNQDENVGLFEESEETEYQAALASLVKGKKRLTSAAIVKIEPGMAPPKPLSKKKKIFTNNDLPAGCQDNNIIGSQTTQEAWIIDASEATAILDKLWKYTYGARIRHDVESDGAVFFIADQRVVEWQSAFSTAAVAIIQTFFDNTDRNDKARQEFASHALSHHCFLYECIKESDTGEKPKQTGVFHGPLIIKTLSSHFNSTQGASDVPTLHASSSQLSLGNVERPTIALALSVVAVEQALTLWRDGYITCESITERKAGKQGSVIIKETNPASGRESKETDFNNANWGKAANSYLIAIRENLTGDRRRDERFAKIVNSAKQSSKLAQRSNANASADPSAMQIDEVDERACVCNDTDSDSELDTN